MKKIIVLIMPFIFLLSFCSLTASAFYCGNTPIEKGQSSYMVEEKCGTPISKTNVGVTSEAEGYNKLTIEKWVYQKAGYRIIITMIGDIVSSIKEEKIW